jgi:hypothetical protein
MWKNQSFATAFSGIEANERLPHYAVDREDCGMIQYPSLLASATLRRK